MNSSNFYHPRFSNLLTEALEEKDLDQQNALLAEIERLLMDQMPIIPLYISLDTYVKKEYIRGEYLLPSGDVDFKEAYIEK